MPHLWLLQDRERKFGRLNFSGVAASTLPTLALWSSLFGKNIILKDVNIEILKSFINLLF